MFNVNVKGTDKNKLAPLDMDHKYPATVFFVGDCIYVILMACSSTMVPPSLEVTTEQSGPKSCTLFSIQYYIESYEVSRLAIMHGTVGRVWMIALHPLKDYLVELNRF